MRRLRLAATAIVAVAVSVVGVATVEADRKTKPERKEIAAVVGYRSKCVHVRISTKTEPPRWAAADLPAKDDCENSTPGEYVLKNKRHGEDERRWRVVKFVTQDTECEDLYRKVPRKVVNDLGVFCF